MMHPRAALALLAPALLLPGGCFSAGNDRLTVGRTVPLPAVTDPAAPSPALHEPPPHAPSVLGADRSNWRPTTFAVPIDGTYHPPHHRFSLGSPRVTARQRGVYPTPTSALETDGGTAARQAADGLREPLLAALDLLTLLPRAIAEPLRETNPPRRQAGMSPGGEAYQRAPSLPPIDVPIGESPPATPVEASQ